MNVPRPHKGRGLKRSCLIASSELRLAPNLVLDKLTLYRPEQVGHRALIVFAHPLQTSLHQLK